jgi:hypothetical protein
MPNRVIVSIEHEAASIRQILDAGNSLDDDNLPRFKRYALSRAHVAIPGAVSSLA